MRVPKTHHKVAKHVGRVPSSRGERTGRSKASHHAVIISPQKSVCLSFPGIEQGREGDEEVKTLLSFFPPHLRFSLNSTSSSTPPLACREASRRRPRASRRAPPRAAPCRSRPAPKRAVRRKRPPTTPRPRARPRFSHRHPACEGFFLFFFVHVCVCEWEGATCALGGGVEPLCSEIVLALNIPKLVSHKGLRTEAGAAPLP